MYRSVKKTTLKTKYKCLECEYCKRLDTKIEIYGCYVKCNAPNKCIMGIFNSRDFYCIEHKGINELTPTELNKLKENILKDKSKKLYKEYCYKYFTKKEAYKMIKNI